MPYSLDADCDDIEDIDVLSCDFQTCDMIRSATNKAMASFAASRWRFFIILGFLSLIWGSSFILIKKSVGIFQPEQVALLRLGLSGLAFLPLLVYHRRAVDWRRWYIFVLVGLLGSGIPAFLFAFAQQHISSSVAGILNSLTPLFTLLVGIVVFRSPLLWMKIIGVAIGLSGATLLIWLGQGLQLRGDVIYNLFIVLAAVCYAFNTNIVGNMLHDQRSVLISTVSFASVGIPALGVLLLTTDFRHTLMTHPQGWIGLGYVCILSLVGTVLATIIFFQLIQQTNPVFASTVAYIMPVVALGWGVFDGERIALYHFAGMALILTGVYLSRK